jgi:hypothetical protein
LDNRALNQAASTARELAKGRADLQPEAVRAALRWVEAMPGFWQPELGLGMTYLAVDQPDLAIAALKRVGEITTEPNANESAQRLLVTAFEALGRDAEATAVEQQAERFAALARAAR